MPYKQIQWVKLEKRLLNDYRFYIMSDSAQLLYIKLLLMAAETNNQIPKDPNVLILSLRLRCDLATLNQCIQEIRTKFPKFKEDSNHMYFEEFGTKHNWVFPSSSSGNPEELPGTPTSFSYSLYNTYKHFEQIWNKYPYKIGKKEAFIHFKASVKTEEDWKKINLALENYLASEIVQKDGGKYIQCGKTWFNNWEDWVVPPKDKSDPYLKRT